MKIFKITHSTINLMGDHLWDYVAAEDIHQASEEYNKAKSIELIGNVIILSQKNTKQQNSNTNET